MAAKVPAVVSDVGGLRDFVQHMYNGVTTYSGNPQSLAWGDFRDFEKSRSG